MNSHSCSSPAKGTHSTRVRVWEKDDGNSRERFDNCALGCSGYHLNKSNPYQLNTGHSWMKILFRRTTGHLDPPSLNPGGFGLVRRKPQTNTQIPHRVSASLPELGNMDEQSVSAAHLHCVQVFQQPRLQLLKVYSGQC